MLTRCPRVGDLNPLSAGHILVIAPNPDFRHSLAFALETEGYSVETQGELASLDQVERFDAIILDHKAFRRESLERVIDASRSPVPVILLASRPQDWLSTKAFRTVPTPLMGTVLSDAVADAVAAPQATHLS
jgi:CheY-like chemotaxis protein